MPKKSKTSPQPHTRLLLSGDVASPAELLASRALTERQKRETLQNWLRDLEHAPDSKGTQAVRKSIHEALARLT